MLLTLPTYSQIKTVETTNSDKLPMWLYDYLGECSGDTSATVHFVDCEQAYWTATALGAEDAHVVSLWNGGSLGARWVGYGGGDWSVRPVITISKDQME